MFYYPKRSYIGVSSFLPERGKKQGLRPQASLRGPRQRVAVWKKGTHLSQTKFPPINLPDTKGGLQSQDETVRFQYPPSTKDQGTSAQRDGSPVQRQRVLFQGLVIKKLWACGVQRGIAHWCVDGRLAKLFDCAVFIDLFSPLPCSSLQSMLPPGAGCRDHLPAPHRPDALRLPTFPLLAVASMMTSPQAPARLGPRLRGTAAGRANSALNYKKP